MPLVSTRMAFWWKRYEPILEARPVPAVEALKDLIAKELVELFEHFPPPEHEVEFEDAKLAAKLKGRMHELPKLDIAMVTLVCRLLRLDLEHEIDAIDHLMRNDHHRDAATTPAHVDAMHLLWRGLLEHLYARKEETQGALKTKDLAEIVDKARDRFVQRQNALA
jgi:hypothetical protein